MVVSLCLLAWPRSAHPGPSFTLQLTSSASGRWTLLTPKPQVLAVFTMPLPPCGRAKPGPCGGLTGSPDESGTKRQKKGLARAGNARARKGMIQRAWRLLDFQQHSALAKWFRACTENNRGLRKKMIVALARRSRRLVALCARWRRARRRGPASCIPKGIGPLRRPLDKIRPIQG